MTSILLVLTVRVDATIAKGARTWFSGFQAWNLSSLERTFSIDPPISDWVLQVTDTCYYTWDISKPDHHSINQIPFMHKVMRNTELATSLKWILLPVPDRVYNAGTFTLYIINIWNIEKLCSTNYNWILLQNVFKLSHYETN